MVDSDDDYVQEDDYEDENDFNLNDGGAGGSSSGGRSYGTRAKGKGKASRQGQRAKERWEGTIKKDFGSLREDADGRIEESLEGIIEARKRKRLRQDTKPFQRGIIRHVILILDLGEAMLEKDMRPNRFIVMLRYVQEYVREFFEQNPISQMSIMAMYDGICIRISELSGNPTDHINAIQAIRNPRNPRETPKEPKGTPSLQNALELSRAALYHTPSHGTREVIIVLGALLSLDPGDITKTIQSCIRDHIRVSIIGMSGRLRICHEIVSQTNAGDDSGYTVALDQHHFRDLLMATTTPPVIRTAAGSTATASSTPSNPASLLMMGFPSRVIEDLPTLCACHGMLTRGGYTCSRCQAKICSLPATCPSCHLTLILSTHLARSYHHLFPLRNWIEVSWARAKEKRSTQCKGCLTPFPPVPPNITSSTTKTAASNATTNGAKVAALAEEAAVEGRSGTDGAAGQEAAAMPIVPRKKVEGASESSRYECESCKNHFCIDCDLFCHEVVHNCPGCLSTLGTEGAAAQNGEAMDVG